MRVVINYNDDEICIFWECSSHKIVELLNNKFLREIVQMAAEPFNMLNQQA